MALDGYSGQAQGALQQPVKADDQPQTGYDASTEAYQKKDVGTLVAWFQDAEEASMDERKLAEKCRDYYDTEALTAAELAILNKRRQPSIQINRIFGKVNYLTGYEAAQRTDPKGFPRNPDDEDAADACTDSLRYVMQKTALQQVFSTDWEYLLIEGTGGCEVLANVANGDAEIEVKVVHWDRYWRDPHSRELDFSDARYHGMVVWMDEDDAVSQWPKSQDFIASTISEDATLTYADRPAWKQWGSSGRRRRVRIVQCYYRIRQKNGEDLWVCSIFTKGGELEFRECKYRDEDGKSLCDLYAQSLFVDRKNNRYGFVKAMLGPQDEINKRRSKMLHEANVRQFAYTSGAVDDVEKTREELARPDGAIEMNPGGNGDPNWFQMIDRSKELSAHASLQQEAKQEIDLMGPNAALLGKGGQDSSGRAILANQQGGQVEIARPMDRLNHLKWRVYKHIWAIIRAEWSEQKWIRVTDDENNAKFVGLNRPVTMAEDLIQQAVKAGASEQDAKQAIKDKLSQVPPQFQQHAQAQLQQVVRTEHVPADMNMDIIIEQVPDVANIQSEQFGILADLAKSKAVPIPPKVIIKASGLRNKQELLDELDKATSAPPPDPAAEAMKQVTIQKAVMEIEELKATIDKIKADTVQSLAKADALDLRFQQVILPQAIAQAGLVPQPQLSPSGPQNGPQGQGIPQEPQDQGLQPPPPQGAPGHPQLTPQDIPPSAGDQTAPIIPPGAYPHVPGQIPNPAEMPGF